MLRSRLLAVQERRIAALRHAYVSYAASLDALSPLKVLARGYAVPSLPDGRLVRSADDAEIGECVKLTLSDGALRCRVEGSRVFLSGKAVLFSVAELNL